MSPDPIRLLVVDDEQHVRTSLDVWFREEGFEVLTAGSGREALRVAEATPPHIVLLDIKMPQMDGLEVQRRLNQLLPGATVIMMTAYAAVDTAVEALKEGAYDYIVKPFDPEDLSRLVRKAAERYTLMEENRALRQRLEAAVPRIIAAEGSPMAAVTEQAERVAETDTNVLIQGESGTGKELLARLIHCRSERRFGPLVAVNCGALAEGLLESELFGHEKGAFTGAVARRKGKLELAHEGTLFLDEVGDIPPKMQVDLLRVLERHRLTRVGGNTPVEARFRLVAATNKDLRAEVEAGRFREDLYFRVNVFELRIPPLRERPADIPLLAEAFVARLNQKMNRRVEGFTDEALAALCAHSWPGNVRELQNAIERAMVVCRGRLIDAQHFPFAAAPAAEDLSLAGLEGQHIRKVLAMTDHNVSRAARILGIDRVTLYNKMKKHGISRP